MLIALKCISSNLLGNVSSVNLLFLSLLVALQVFCTTIILGLSSDVSLGIPFVFILG